MPYRIYHTDAIVLASFPKGDADRVYDLYTRELGAVRGEARSIRREASRLRYTLQTFSRAEVDLLRGKHGWRISTARPIDSHRDIWEDPMRRAVLASIARLLRRLVQGEDADPALYAVILRELELLAGTPVETAALRSRECVALVRVLSVLGYWDVSGPWGYLVPPSTDEASVLAQMRPTERALIAEINRVLKETHL